MGDDEAGMGTAFGRGGWVKPAAEGYCVGCFERDILPVHDGPFEINFGEEDKREWSKIVEKWV